MINQLDSLINSSKKSPKSKKKSGKIICLIKKKPYARTSTHAIYRITLSPLPTQHPAPRHLTLLYFSSPRLYLMTLNDTFLCNKLDDYFCKGSSNNIEYNKQKKTKNVHEKSMNLSIQ